MKAEAINYILEWLAGAGAGRFVGYTAERQRFGEYNVVIIPSGHFGNGLPAEPLTQIDGVPLLFGRDEVTRVGDTIVVYADIVASTFFLISRYEEVLQRDKRDEHGRFPGKASLPYRQGFIHRPVADEYAALLQGWLRHTGVPLPPAPAYPHLNTLYLTHDVDAPFLYRSWKGFARSLLHHRGLTASLQSKFGAPTHDPWYTFPQLFTLDNELAHTFGTPPCQVIYFFKASGHTPLDKPHYSLSSPDIRSLLHAIRLQPHTAIGLHASYHAGLHPSAIAHEKIALEQAINAPVTLNRHHFLALREPEHTDFLESAGITDDFTLGYADTAGYRLGTSRPVRYIHPTSFRLSNLTLHPLTAMDTSLLHPRYMSLTPSQAVAHTLQIIHNAARLHGDASLLWHNSSDITPYALLTKLLHPSS
ncbi:MAG: polysaccharide deacetylase family protein [Tannerellaceae bacterium]|nr:polysaccharide deacetylase family protein [Tannerellaceae bacterium]